MPRRSTKGIEERELSTPLPLMAGIGLTARHG